MITPPVPARKFWPMVNGGPPVTIALRGALIVTPEPVWAIEPMLIACWAMGGWPWSADGIAPTQMVSDLVG